MIIKFISRSSLAAVLLASGSVYAQDSTLVSTDLKPFAPASSFRTWSLGINAGVLSPTLPFGKNDFTTWKPQLGYGAYVKKQIIPALGIKAGFLAGKLEGDNSEPYGSGITSQSPYDAFETTISYSGSLIAELNLANIYWMNRRNTITPYFNAGAGLMGYNINLTDISGVQSEFKEDGNVNEVFFPVGAGLKFSLSQSVNLDLGYTMNFVDGDNLDGYRNAPQDDKFSYGHIGLEFALGKKSKPQLATYNPVAAMEHDYITRNADLKSQLEAERASNAQRLAQIDAEWKKFLNDADKDGVSDHFDKCPDTPEGTQVDGAGCPLKVTTTTVNPVTVITEEDRRVVAEAIRNLEFDFAKATIRSKSYPSLNRVAELLVTKNFSLKLAGHTDNVGSNAANLKLSKNRAESVKAYLVSQGANPSRIEAVGYGETQPISSNKTDAGRQKNRRVEFTLY
ncbi:OmpA family protein [Flavihumibacter sp. R14]|nr:OmpA family protein [Flavihumibacter soli]